MSQGCMEPTCLPLLSVFPPPAVYTHRTSPDLPVLIYTCQVPPSIILQRSRCMPRRTGSKCIPILSSTLVMCSLSCCLSTTRTFGSIAEVGTYLRSVCNVTSCDLPSVPPSLCLKGKRPGARRTISPTPRPPPVTSTTCI